MKPDEAAFLLALAAAPKSYVRELIAQLGMHPNRAAYICEKWTRKRWYDYGVNVLAGWLTPKGLEVAASLDPVYGYRVLPR